MLSVVHGFLVLAINIAILTTLCAAFLSPLSAPTGLVGSQGLTDERE